MFRQELSRIDSIPIFFLTKSPNIKIGIQNEYVSKSDNDFSKSDQFKNIVSESIIEYRSGKTEDMDIL